MIRGVTHKLSLRLLASKNFKPTRSVKISFRDNNLIMDHFDIHILGLIFFIWIH